ncbi:biotin transporter BioY [Candidatus Cardinium hertigii]|uniref:Biotin transporter n=1 Tax=Candidatus Cardinium hertigii TaxID=247481 RepID=A0A2Z3LIC2_9BACT|nr:biotin transporter BioY [Candidatus Cardinium hertigii]AWN81810.1 Biotin transporter BioY2 [Candidatus Cardinium hertigii]
MSIATCNKIIRSSLKYIRCASNFHRITAILSAIALLAVCTQISVPLKPVPVTMQSFAVLFIGIFYSKCHAYSAVIVYLLIGMMGIPVFANFGSGISYIMGPTGGFLIGFLVALYPMSWYKTYLSDIITVHSVLLLCLLGSLAIFGCGYLWLIQYINAYKAFHLGIKPFIVGEIAKWVFLMVIARIKKISI